MRCVEEMCELCGETFSGEDLKTCKRMQCDREAYPDAGGAQEEEEEEDSDASENDDGSDE